MIEIVKDKERYDRYMNDEEWLNIQRTHPYTEQSLDETVDQCFKKDFRFVIGQWVSEMDINLHFCDGTNPQDNFILVKYDNTLYKLQMDKESVIRKIERIECL